jgi:hypothetical protein
MEASGLVGVYKAEQPAYLRGDFVVTGVLGQRAALRTRDSLRNPNADPNQPGSDAALIVIDYPAGATPPAKDTMFSRGSNEAFAIRDIIRGRTGQITIIATPAP